MRSRYDLKEKLGEGGMGIVYRAYDRTLNIDVALKTLRDITHPKAIQRFHQECDRLATLVHPNIIEIRDRGELEENGAQKPYLVMPLLPGVTLDKLSAGSGRRLTVDRCVDIICQVCRGLQSAHEQGLVHRDIKPSNIFILEGDSVKLIDFGLVQFTDTSLTNGREGTLLYMSPEQIRRQPLTQSSDIFALGVVAYEVLAGKRPFEGDTEAQVEEAILNSVPTPIYKWNPAVNTDISRVIQKALAKSPYDRYSSAREFSEYLKKAYHGQPIEIFDPARLRPRLQRAVAAFDKGDFSYASEVVSELEAEGHVNDEIAQLRGKIDRVIHDKEVSQLLESARSRIETQDYRRALEKIQTVLTKDRDNREAMVLKDEVEHKLAEDAIRDGCALARQHMEKCDYDHARRAIENVLKLEPRNPSALQLESEINLREKEYLAIRAQKEELYREAQERFQRGDVSSALSHIQKVVDLDRQAPERANPEQANSYQALYKQVRSESDAIDLALAEVRRLDSAGQYQDAIATCDQVLSKYPSHAVFQGMKLTMEHRQQQQLLAYIAQVETALGQEPELNRQLAILKDALTRYPDAQHFVRQFDLTRKKNELVQGIMAEINDLESRRQFGEALARCEILRTICASYPGLDFEVERLRKAQELQASADAKTRYVQQIEQQLDAGNSARAIELLGQAEEQFSGDAELAALAGLAERHGNRAAEFQVALKDGRSLFEQHRYLDSIAALDQALQLESSNAEARALLVDALVQQAKTVLDADWRESGKLLDRALALEPRNSAAAGLRRLALERQGEEEIAQCLAQARQDDSQGNPREAALSVQQLLKRYPGDPRLIELYRRLTGSYGDDGGVTRAATTVDSGMQPPAVETPTVSPNSPRKGRLETMKVRVDAVPTIAAEPSAPRRFPGKIAILIAVVIGIIGVGAFLIERARPAKQVTATVPPNHRVQLTTNPPGASIFVDGNPKGNADGSALDLPDGPYTFEARLPGYEPLTDRLNVPGDFPRRWNLVPVAAGLVIDTNLAAPQVTMDAAPLNLTDGLVSLQPTSPASHVLKLSDNLREFKFSFESKRGEAMAIKPPLVVKGLTAVAFSLHAGAATVSANPGVVVQMDSQAPAKITGAEILIPDVGAGQHTLTISDGPAKWTKTLNIGKGTSLTLFVLANLDTGTLILHTEPPGVEIYVDGRQRGVATNGRWSLQLPAGRHKVRIAKADFGDMEDVPVDIKKGEEVAKQFKLAPRVVGATMILATTPGAEVTISGKTYTVPQDGTLIANSLPVGSMKLWIQKRPFRGIQQDLRIIAGENRLNLMLNERLPGRLSVTGRVADEKITCTKGLESFPIVSSVTALAEGEYLCSLSAPGFSKREERLRIKADEDTPLEGAIEKARGSDGPSRVAMPPSPRTGPWVPGADGWSESNESGAVPLAVPSPMSSISFVVQSPGGRFHVLARDHVTWRVSQPGAKNYVEFKLDETKISCTQVMAGASSKCGSASLTKSEVRSIRIDLTPTTVTLMVDERPIPLRVESNLDLTIGHFAFVGVDSKKPVRIKDFKPR